MSSERSIISFRSVRKVFGKHVVLNDFNLEVAASEKLALIGPSGSGKSTILRILMTLEDIQEGELEIDGDLLWQHDGERTIFAERKLARKIRQKVGMVFQQFNLFPHMTAVRNVAEAPHRVLELPKEEAYARARELLTLVGLSDKENAYPVQLSGGQQQRVAIARALAMRPKILLFDEVTSALDPEIVGEVLNVIRMLTKQFDFTTLIVTHQMGFAREMCDRVCFLENGQIVEQGSPDELFASPRNERTQSFLRAILEA